MSRDLGWSATFEPLASSQILDQLERGEVDVGLFLSHPRADHLDKRGLIYERHSIARTEGPAGGPGPRPRGHSQRKNDAGRALTQVIAAAGAGQKPTGWRPPPFAIGLADTLTNGWPARA